MPETLQVSQHESYPVRLESIVTELFESGIAICSSTLMQNRLPENWSRAAKIRFKAVKEQIGLAQNGKLWFKFAACLKLIL